MTLPLTYYGNPILRKKGVPITEITDEIKQLVHDMTETMHANNGIGLAAQQIGKAINLFITEAPIPKKNEETGEVTWEPGQLRVFINPKIIKHSEDLWASDEGCLSIPNLYGHVDRPIKVTVQAMGLDGKVFEEEFEWLSARAILHENDHINGVLFIDRIHGKERKNMENKLREIKKKYM